MDDRLVQEVRRVAIEQLRKTITTIAVIAWSVGFMFTIITSVNLEEPTTIEGLLMIALYVPLWPMKIGELVAQYILQ